MEQAIYDSGLHHPLIAWLGTALLVIALVRRSGFVRRWGVIFGATTALDALCTGAWSPLPPGLGSSVGILFVILGDLRLFAFAERVVSWGATSRAWIARAVALSFVIPILQGAIIRFAFPPDVPLRHIFLTYELLFLCFGVVFFVILLPRRLRAASPELVRGVARAVQLYLATYLLWIVADFMILAGVPGALVFRIIPNTLYYAVFLFAVVRLAPAEMDDPGSR